MKLILTQEVTGLGSPGDVVEVKDGYGQPQARTEDPWATGPSGGGNAYAGGGGAPEDPPF